MPRQIETKKFIVSDIKDNIKLMNQTKRSAWVEHPDYHMDIERTGHRAQIIYNKVTVADSNNVLQVQELDYPLRYYFPREDIKMDLLYPIDEISFCPFKGEATYWALVVDSKRIDRAAWCYKAPFPEVKQLKNYFAFYPEAIEKLIRN